MPSLFDLMENASAADEAADLVVRKGAEIGGPQFWDAFLRLSAGNPGGVASLLGVSEAAVLRAAAKIRDAVRRGGPTDKKRHHMMNTGV